MGSFLYYFPDRVDAIARNVFSEADKKSGLDLILRDASLAVAGMAAGPDDTRGTMIATCSDAFNGTEVALNKDAQKWKRVNAHYWLGWYTDGRRPSAAGLKRPKQIGGEPVVVRDEEWLIPCCGPRFTRLPQSFVLDDKDQWTPVVQNEYLHLMEDSERAIEDMRSADKANYAEVYQRHVEFCARMLAVNYHVGRHEVSALEVVTSSCLMEILRSATGMVTFEREMGKQRADTEQVG